jgi:LCP family protein required for cell wall assembly
MKIDFLDKVEEKQTKKSPLFVRSAIVLAIITPIFFLQLTSIGNLLRPLFKIEPGLGNIEFQNITEWVGEIGRIIRSDDKSLQGEKDDRINILLLGMGGVGHDGAYLTDTIILASIKPKDKKISMISIPRDLVIPLNGYGWRKVNNINAFAEVKESGSGSKETARILSEVFDIPIHYYIRADFDGFKKLIDRLGGISVYVDRSFVDNQYPTLDEKYQTLTFFEGWQVMDGETALEFVRSRHGSNGEGSDFARSKRQQKILVALKDKIFSFSTIFNPLKIQGIYSDITNSIDTNLKMWEIMRLRKVIEDIDTNNIINKVISDDKGNLLVAANIDGAYVLEPKTGNFNEIQSLIKNIFETNEPKEPQKKLPLRVELQNGTKINGLASRTSWDLENLGYEIIKICNAQEQNYSRTIIYDLTAGKRREELDILREKLNAEVSFSPPSWLVSSVNPSQVDIDTPSPLTDRAPIDFLIILGASYDGN